MGDTKRCPACAETIQANARICRFCKHSFDAPAAMSPAPAAPAPKKSNTTMIVLIVVGAVGLFLILPCMAALLLPAIARAISNAKIAGCANNLQQLSRMQSNYVVMHGGLKKQFSSQTGEQFWLVLSDPNVKLIDRDLADVYQCPLEGKDQGWGSCDYRGPSSNVNLYGDGDPIGADKVGNHGSRGGGNVLRKSGEVTTVGESDSLWIQAGAKTTP